MRKYLLFTLAIMASGCATIIHGSKQDVSISSTPSGASVTINGQNMGVTPTVVRLARKTNQAIKVALPGYSPYEIILARKVDGWIAGNIVFGGLIGLVIDAVDGAMYKLTPDQVGAVLKEGSASLMQDKKDAIWIGVTLSPNPNWEKIGYLQKK